MITLLGEDAASNPADGNDATAWADTFKLNHPVVADPNWSVTARFTSGSIGLPSMHQLAAGMEVLQTQTRVSEMEIEDALPK